MGAEDLPIEALREGARLYEQGKHYESISEYRKAIECYRAAMEATFPDPVILNNIGYCYLLLNEIDECKDTLWSVLELEPENVEALHNLAMVLIDTEEYEEAESLARRGIEVDRANSGNWSNLGRTLYANGRFEDAREAIATAIGYAPDRADSHYVMGLVLNRIGDEDNAHRSFLRAVELEDDNVQHLMGLGRCLLNLKQPETAEKYLRRAVEVEELNHEALTMLAESLIEQAITLKENVPETMLGEAMELLNRSLDLMVTHPETWYLWGRVRMMFHDWENAERFLRVAVEGKCEDSMAWAYLSYVLGQLGRGKEATEMFEEYKRIANITVEGDDDDVC